MVMTREMTARTAHMHSPAELRHCHPTPPRAQGRLRRVALPCMFPQPAVTPGAEAELAAGVRIEYMCTLGLAGSPMRRVCCGPDSFVVVRSLCTEHRLGAGIRGMLMLLLPELQRTQRRAFNSSEEMIMNSRGSGCQTP